MHTLTKARHGSVELYPPLGPGFVSVPKTKKFSKKFQDFSSHRIFRHMYKVLNIDENKINHTVYL